MIRAFLFDFNGVLVDDEPLHRALLERVLGEEGLGPPPDSGPGWSVGISDRTALERALAAAGRDAPVERLARLEARKHAYYQGEIVRTGYPWFPGAARFVTSAARAGLALAVVSGARRSEVEAGLDQEGLRERFEVLVTADDVTRGKPDPEGYRLALALLNGDRSPSVKAIGASEAVAIEDSPAGLEAAAACGLRTVAVAHSFPAARLARAALVVPTIAGLHLETLLERFA